MSSEFHGSASNWAVAWPATRMLGGKWAGMLNDPDDFVGIGIGFNTPNLYRLIRSICRAKRLGRASATDVNLGEKPAPKKTGSDHTYVPPVRRDPSTWKEIRNLLFYGSSQPDFDGLRTLDQLTNGEGE